MGQEHTVAALDAGQRAQAASRVGADPAAAHELTVWSGSRSLPSTEAFADPPTSAASVPSARAQAGQCCLLIGSLKRQPVTTGCADE